MTYGNESTIIQTNKNSRLIGREEAYMCRITERMQNCMCMDMAMPMFTMHHAHILLSDRIQDDVRMRLT